MKNNRKPKLIANLVGFEIYINEYRTPPVNRLWYKHI